MSVALRKELTLDAFLAWERAQELRYEFDGVQPIAMTGDSLAHSIIGTNIVIALDGRPRSGCRAFRGDVKVLVAGRVRYPDVAVTCSPLDASSDIVPAPIVLFEVLSPSTENVDRTVKATEYFATPSIQHYVLLSQSMAFVEV
jgi:Uma2 family endonuclease